MTIDQISVFLENRAGQLSEITSVLADNNVDLRAIHIAETADYGVLRLIAADSREASRILLEHGFILNMTPVVVVGVPDEAGGLAKLLSVVSGAGIDIEYMYSAFGMTSGTACMVLRVSDVKKLTETLHDYSIVPLTGEDLGVK